MKIARTSVQQIYASGRKKLAEVLVEGLPLKIEGGDYQLCRGEDGQCRRPDCIKQQYKKAKGETIMRIAVTYENSLPGELRQTLVGKKGCPADLPGELSWPVTSDDIHRSWLSAPCARLRNIQVFL